MLVDFDGTLSPIVSVADEARPLAGVREVLAELSETYAVVAVVSGRPLRYLIDHLGPGPRLVGLYGLEWTDHGQPAEHPEAASWRAVIDGAAREAGTVLPGGIDVEHKGLSLTLHYRPVPEAAPAVAAWATEVADRTGLHQRVAKMSVELHPPIAVDKGTVVCDLCEGLESACYLGDDVGDLPAFAALDALRVRGLRTVKVAVTGADAAPELITAADILTDGPGAALALLRSLL